MCGGGVAFVNLTIGMGGKVESWQHRGKKLEVVPLIWKRW